MKNPIANCRKPVAIFVAITMALTLIGLILRIVNLYTNFEISTGYYYSSAILVDIMHIFFVLSVIAIGVLSFVLAKKMLLESIESEKDPTTRVVLYFLAIAAIAYILAKSYFDVYFAFNSPNKILLHMVCLAAMFLFVVLARINLGILKEKAYLFFLAATAFLSGVYAIPSMFFCIISPIYREYTYFYFDIVILAVFTFAVTKLVLLITSKKPQTNVEPVLKEEVIFDKTPSNEDAKNVTSESNDTTPEKNEEE